MFQGFFLSSQHLWYIVYHLKRSFWLERERGCKNEIQPQPIIFESLYFFMSIGHMRKFAVKKCKWRKKDPSLMILCSQTNKSLLVIGQGSCPHPYRYILCLPRAPHRAPSETGLSPDWLTNGGSGNTSWHLSYFVKYHRSITRQSRKSRMLIPCHCSFAFKSH